MIRLVGLDFALENAAQIEIQLNFGQSHQCIMKNPFCETHFSIPARYKRLVVAIKHEQTTRTHIRKKLSNLNVSIARINAN